MQVSLPKGVFILSLDLEMAWGFNHLPASRLLHHQYEQVPRIVDRLLGLMERYEISATWATVGHLFLDRCRPVDDVKHPEISRPKYDWLARDWFEPDPCSDVGHEPHWYAPELIDRIAECRVPQEIGCHNFSHVIVGDSGCSPETFQSELDNCKRLAEDKGIDLKSFVFPKNSVGQLDLLVKNGFTNYRGPEPCWFAGLPFPLWRVAHKIDRFFPIVPPVVFPSFSEGIWNIPGSAYYVDRESKWGKWLPIGMRVWKAKKSLRQAAQQKGLYHLWFHPYNLASDVEGLFHGLEQIFAEVSELRAKGLLDNLTMGQITENLTAQAARDSASLPV